MQTAGEDLEINLVLVETEGEINLGFIARLAVNFNINSVYLVNPKANLLSDDVKRFAAKAHNIVSKFK